MWHVLHKPTQIVVASTPTRREAYDIIRSYKGITDERYRVEKS